MMIANDNGKWSLPEGWQYVLLRDIAEISYGKGLTVSQRIETGSVPVYGSSGIVGYHNQAIAPGPSLIIGRKGAAGAVHYSPVDSWPIDTAYYARFPDGISTKYAYYALQTLELSSLDRSTAIPSLSRDDLYVQSIPLAPFPTQHRIVAEIEKQFTRLDAAVAALRRAKANLARYKAAVLKAAVEGRLVARADRPQRSSETSEVLETASVLLARILAERRAQWEAANPKKKYVKPKGPDVAGLPALPEGWVWATVEQLAAHEPQSITDGPFGSKLKTEHYTESGPRVIRLQNIGDGEFIDAMAHISDEHYQFLKRHSVFAGDLVIAGLGMSLPRACIIPDYVGPAIVKADCIRFKPHPKIADSRYLNAALNSEPLKQYATMIVHGVGRPRLNQEEIRSLVVPIPPLREQERIADEVELHLSMIKVTERTIDANLTRADRLRQAVLARAFRGELVANGDGETYGETSEVF